MVVGDGPAFQAYMEQWRKDHPGDWRMCPACRNWKLGPIGDHCPLCPPPKREVKTNRQWARRGAGYEDGSFKAGPYGSTP